MLIVMVPLTVRITAQLFAILNNLMQTKMAEEMYAILHLVVGDVDSRNASSRVNRELK